jgi:hypothetical protein
MKGGIPYSGTLLLSLASEKEGEINQNVVIETESLPFTLHISLGCNKFFLTLSSSLVNFVVESAF